MSDHEVAFKIYLKNYPEVTREEYFTVSIKLCELEVTANSFNYTVGDPGVTEYYALTASEACAGFYRDVSITGLPSFLHHDVGA